MNQVCGAVLRVIRTLIFRLQYFYLLSSFIHCILFKVYSCTATTVAATATVTVVSKSLPPNDLWTYIKFIWIKFDNVVFQSAWRDSNITISLPILTHKFLHSLLYFVSCLKYKRIKRTTTTTIIVMKKKTATTKEGKRQEINY